MLISTEFSDIPGFSKLFIDYLAQNPYLQSRFPANSKLFTDLETLKNKAVKFGGRAHLQPLIKNSMEGIQLSQLQLSNLNQLNKSNSLVVVTGQQIGFLGGPLYTFLKSLDTVVLSKKLASKYPELNFIPVFWVEDNDHDSLEASNIHVFGNDYKPVQFLSTPSGFTSGKTIVADKAFGNDIEETIGRLKRILPESDFSEELFELLEQTYRPGENWSVSFINLMNNWLGSLGILFIRASIARISGLFDELALKELEKPGFTESLIEKANTGLSSYNYHIQAKSFKVNLFLHKEHSRYKPEIGEREHLFRAGDKDYSLDELIKYGAENKGAFSPNVLLRPVFQDKVIPTATYIGGPSEIGYSAQINELYDYFNVPMPAFISRHSATFIDQRASHFIEKNGYEPLFFFNGFTDIEAILRLRYYSNDFNKIISNAKAKLNNIFDELTIQAEKIETTLRGSAGLAYQKILQQVEFLEKKISSAQHRKYSDMFLKHEQTSNLIFPNGNLQERYYSPLNFINIVGIKRFTELCLEIMEKENGSHYFVNLFRMD